MSEAAPTRTEKPHDRIKEMGREWLFKENPFDLIKKIENAVYTCSPALRHRQTGLLLTRVRPACLCFFISAGRFWGLEIMQLSHGLHGCLRLDAFFGWLAPTWESSSVKTAFTNILVAVIDWRWRQKQKQDWRQICFSQQMIKNCSDLRTSSVLTEVQYSL